MEFSGQTYINHICKRLWSRREYGNAAVMVGAGFSRNAESIDNSNTKFPLWSDLLVSMCQELFPKKHNETVSNYNPRIQQIIIDNGSLRIAELYSHSFTRSKLDTFLIERIANDTFYPGYCHKLLLELPWSEIFTTNYDTLLERTRDKVVNFKYKGTSKNLLFKPDFCLI